MEFTDLAQLRANYFVVRSAKKQANVLDPIYVGNDEREALLVIKSRRRESVKGDHLFELPARSVRHLFGWYINLAGLNPRVSFHALRHVACKAIMNAANQNHLYCTVRLRHESLGGNNTSYRYALPTRSMMVEAANVKGVIL
jgi:integrase